MAKLDVEAVELLCSRLCHDLAGPVGAIRNGIELIEESSDGDTGEALSLIDHSADQVARRLQLYRLAYGRAAREGQGVFKEVREAGQRWLAGGRVTIDWPAAVEEETLALQPGLAKVTLNLMVLAAEMLPHGGIVSVALAGGRESGLITVSAYGKNLRPIAEFKSILAGNVPAEGLGPRSIHVAACAGFASHYGLSLSAAPQGEGRIDIVLRW